MENLKAANWLDFVVLIFLIRGVYLGVRNGLTAELLRFIGTIVALVLAVQWHSQVADILTANLALPAWLSQFLCFVVIAQLIKVIFKYGLVMLLKILHLQFMPPLERPGGAIIGLARGVFVSGIFVLMLSFFPLDYIKESIYDKSFSGNFLVKSMQRTYKSLVFWLPEEKTEEAIFMITPTRKKVKKPPPEKLWSI